MRDHGIGVDPEDVPKLFDRFSRVQRKETMAIPGSGLGLYIAHHIVEAHGGTLKLESAPGGGTIAEVTVPLIVEPARDGGDPSTNGKDAGPSLGDELITVIAPMDIHAVTSAQDGHSNNTSNGSQDSVQSEKREKELVG